MFKVTDEDFAHQIANHVLFYMEKEVDTYKWIFFHAHHNSSQSPVGTPLGSQSLKQAEQYQNYSRFGDFYRWIPTCSRLCPLRHLESQKELACNFVL